MKRSLVGLAAVTALALVSALGLTLAPHATATAAAASPGTQAGRLLLPDAGWHGRAVQEPHRHDTARASAPPPLAGWSAGPAELGTGTHRADGSRRVREVQRRLRRLGYASGPVDGVFGPRTRAAVGWFQRKHGLPVEGRATAATVRHLRARTGAAGPGPAPAPAPAPTQVTPGTAPSSPPEPVPTPARDGSPDGGLPLAIAAAVLAGLGLAAAGVALARTPRSAPTSRPPATIPVRRAGRAAGASGPAGAIGYVRLAPGAPGASFHAQAAAIEAGCIARGLTLVSLVSDREPDPDDLERPPALSFAVDRIASGEVDRLVVSRLDHLARSPEEAQDLVDAIAGHAGALVVLDRDLDTAGLEPADAVQELLRPERRPVAPPSLRGEPEERRTVDAHIWAMLRDGLGADEVAAALNAEPVPPPGGSRRRRAWAEDDVRRAEAALRTERFRG